MRSKEGAGMERFRNKDIWDVFEYMLFSFLLSTFYYIYEFRIPKGLTFKGSLILFCTLICGFGSYKLMTREKPGGCKGILDQMIPCGIFTLIAYRDIYPKLTCAVCAAVPFLCLTYWLYSRQHVSANSRRHGKRTGMKQTYDGLGWIIRFSMFGLLSLIGFNSVFSDTIMHSSELIITVDQLEEYKLDDHMDEVACVATEEWDSISVSEKVNVLQVIANIERTYLGIPYELNVAVDDTGKYTLGYYSDSRRIIAVSAYYLECADSWEIVNTICHEAYHSYQYSLVSLYEESPDELKNLYLFRKVRKYREEFDHYCSGDESFNEYYLQQCETDARDYAAEAEYEYYRRISAYVYGLDG